MPYDPTLDPYAMPGMLGVPAPAAPAMGPNPALAGMARPEPSPGLLDPGSYAVAGPGGGAPLNPAGMPEPGGDAGGMSSSVAAHDAAMARDAAKRQSNNRSHAYGAPAPNSSQPGANSSQPAPPVRTPAPGEAPLRGTTAQRTARNRAHDILEDQFQKSRQSHYIAKWHKDAKDIKQGHRTVGVSGVDPKLLEDWADKASVAGENAAQLAQAEHKQKVANDDMITFAINKAQDKRRNAIKAMQDRQRAALAEVDKRREAMANEIAGMKIKDGNVSTDNFWANKSTGQEIGAAIALSLGALGQAFAGAPQSGNLAMAVMNKAIERDLQEQKRIIANSRQEQGRRIGAKRQRLSQLGQHYQEVLARTGDEILAENAFQAAGLQMAEKAAKAAAQKAGLYLDDRRSEAMTDKIAEQIAQKKLEYGMRAAGTISTAYKHAPEASGGGYMAGPDDRKSLRILRMQENLGARETKAHVIRRGEGRQGAALGARVARARAQASGKGGKPRKFYSFEVPIKGKDGKQKKDPKTGKLQTMTWKQPPNMPDDQAKKVRARLQASQDLEYWLKEADKTYSGAKGLAASAASKIPIVGPHITGGADTALEQGAGALSVMAGQGAMQGAEGDRKRALLKTKAGRKVILGLIKKTRADLMRRGTLHKKVK